VRTALPLSIIVGAAFIGLGLYLGLRAGSPGPPHTAVTPRAVAAVERPVDDLAALTSEPASAELGVVEANAAVEQARDLWRTACWDGAARATRKAGRYIAVLAFDAGGTLVVSAIDEIRDASDPVIAQCLRQNLGALRIPAPGRPVRVEVPFALP